MNSYLNEGEYSKLETLLINSNLHDTHRLSFGEFWKNLKMARGYNKLKKKGYKEALVDFETAINVPKNIAQHYMASFSSQARRLFYIGYCYARMGNTEKADELWKEALKLKRVSRFQPMYHYDHIKTLYYQTFCLRGLGRMDEADNYIRQIEEFAKSISIQENKGLQRQLLILSIRGFENIDAFDKWDSELGLVRINVNFNAPEE